jgi:hypothetical protein
MANFQTLPTQGQAINFAKKLNLPMAATGDPVPLNIAHAKSSADLPRGVSDVALPWGQCPLHLAPVGDLIWP